MPRKTPQLAKFSRPRLYDAVARERLFKLLDEKRRHPAVWVCGPPGAGKTVLVASYIEARELPVLWYHVDPGDSDLSTFFFFLTEAAKSISPRSKPLPLLTPEYLPDVPGFARRYFRALYSRLPSEGMLVLDNIQDALSTNRFTEVIGAAIAEIPEQLNIVCVSRTDPPAELSNCLSRESMVVIGWDDLQLTLDETTAIVVARGLDIESAKSLHRSAQGWAAGLTLTIERLSRLRSAGLEVEAATRDATFDYFATQLFDAAEPRERELLMGTSLFNTFTTDLAADLVNDPRAAETLDELCRRQLFVYRKGGDDQRFQFHDLFRAFLRSRLISSKSEADLAALRRKAAELLLGRGLSEPAFPLLVDAEEWHAAAALICDRGPRLLAQGRSQTLREWLQCLPESMLKEEPWLQYWLGCARVYEGLSAARAEFESSFEGFRMRNEALGQLLSAAWIIRTYYIEYTDFQPLDRWTEEIAMLLNNFDGLREAEHEIHVLGALMIVFTYRQLGHAMRETVIRRLTDLLLMSDIDLNLRVGAATGLMIYHVLATEQVKAQRIVDTIGPMADREEVSPHNQAWWWMFVGYHYHRAEEKVLPVDALARSDALAASNGLRQTEFYSCCFRTYYTVPWRNYATARAALARIENSFSSDQPMHMAQFNLARYFITISTGDRESATHHAKVAVRFATQLGSPFFYVAWRAQCAVGPALVGEMELAEKWLDEAWQASAGSFLERYRPAILQSRAYCAMLRGDRSRARKLLAESIAMGKENNAWAYARGAVPLFDWMAREALEAGIEVPFIQEYVRKYRVPPPAEEVPNWPWPVKVYTLCEFRVEIDGNPLAFSRKAPKKPLALLKAIVAMGGRNVPEQKLIDALWPDEEGDASREAFAVALHRLRKLLGHPEAVQLSEGAVSLNRNLCWVDTWAFEQACTLIDRDGPDASLAEVDRLWSLYGEHFLAEEVDASWAVTMRERLRSRFLRVLSAVARSIEDAGRPERALELYRRAIETDDLAEEFYQGAIRCLLGMGRHAEAMALLRRLRQTLSVTLGIKPSAQTESLLRFLSGS